MDSNNTAGQGSIIAGAVAAIAMIAATALILPPVKGGEVFGICGALPAGWFTQLKGEVFNAMLLIVAVVAAFFLNRRYSFVKGADGSLPVAMAILLASNPACIAYPGASVAMLIVNLVCLDILMKSYCARNAATEMFAIATYLSVGSMVEYAFLPLVLVYPVMGLMTKVIRLREIIAYGMGLVAPYWVALGFGIIGPSDFRMPEFLTVVPDTGSGGMLIIYVSLGVMALIDLIMTLNNALLFYSGNIRVRTFNNLINLLGITCGISMLVDFGNFEAYAATFCFTSAVQTANFFAIRRIPRSTLWFWSILSIFMALFAAILLEYAWPTT